MTHFINSVHFGSNHKKILNIFIAGPSEQIIDPSLEEETADFIFISYGRQEYDLTFLAKRLSNSKSVQIYMSSDSCPSIFGTKTAITALIKNFNPHGDNFVVQSKNYLENSRICGWVEVQEFAILAKKKVAQLAPELTIIEDTSFSVDGICFRPISHEDQFDRYKDQIAVSECQKLIEEAVLCLNSGASAKGLAILNRLMGVKEYRRIPELYLLKASAECQVGKFEDAMRSICVARESRPNNPNIQSMYDQIKACVRL